MNELKEHFKLMLGAPVIKMSEGTQKLLDCFVHKAVDQALEELYDSVEQIDGEMYFTRNGVKNMREYIGKNWQDAIAPAILKAEQEELEQANKELDKSQGTILDWF